MAEEVRLWRIHGAEVQEVPRGRLDREQRLEEWLARDIGMLDDGLLVIGRQVSTFEGKPLDLLCVDAEGDLVVVELKRDKTPRDVVAQALEYAAWVKDLTTEQVELIAADYLGPDGPLPDAFERRFGAEYEQLNAAHRILVVASELDPSTERIVGYLTDMGVPINAAQFTYCSDESGEYVVRAFVLDPEEVRRRTVRVGGGAKRRWDEAAFREHLRASDLTEAEKTIVERLLELCDKELPGRLRWSDQSKTPAFSYYPLGDVPQSLLTVSSAGHIWWRFAAMRNLARGGRFPEDLVDQLWQAVNAASTRKLDPGKGSPESDVREFAGPGQLQALCEAMDQFSRAVQGNASSQAT